MQKVSWISESLYCDVSTKILHFVIIKISQSEYVFLILKNFTPKNNPFHYLCTKFPTVSCFGGIFRLIRDFCHQNPRGQLANLIFGEENWFVRLKEPQTKRNQDNFLRNKPINYTFFSACAWFLLLICLLEDENLTTDKKKRLV